MATLQDVVSGLISLTKTGDVAWNVNNWDSNGQPTRWSGDGPHGCSYDLVRGEACIRMIINKRWVTLGQGEEIRPLIEVVTAVSDAAGDTNEAALAYALGCLQV